MSDCWTIFLETASSFNVKVIDSVCTPGKGGWGTLQAQAELMSATVDLLC